MKQTAVLVDKKVAGIIRWLERLKTSYSSGAMESALMDAECARADLENLRLDVWATLESKTQTGNKFFSRVMNFSRVASLTALIVLTAVFPISKEVQAPALEYKKSEITLAEPIVVIREEKIKFESDNNLSETHTVNSAKPKRTAKIANIKKPVPMSSSSLTEEKAKVPAETQKAVAYDKVFSLMQTGQRALKNNSSVVKVQ